MGKYGPEKSLDLGIFQAVEMCSFDQIVHHVVKIVSWIFEHMIKGELSGLRKFLATESPLKMMKNYFYFTLKSLSVLKIFKFLS